MNFHRRIVRTALSASTSQLQELCSAGATEALGLSYLARRSSDLSTDLKRAVWSLLERNMRVLLQGSSIGWDSKQKRLELFHRFSRYILVFQGSEHIASKLVAFTMFRFEHEDQENILYCYELQVDQELRGVGIGRNLVSLLESIGSNWSMNKLMLTVLKSNAKATKFYTSAELIVDESSPSASGEVADYEILSKRLSDEFEDLDSDFGP